MSIERTELGIWLLVSAPVTPAKRVRVKRATKTKGQFNLVDAIKRVMNPPALDWSI